MGTKEIKEKATFRIKTADGNQLSFDVNGSVVLAMVEAFSWLAPDRRQTLLARLEKKQEELLAREAARADSKTADLFATEGGAA